MLPGDRTTCIVALVVLSGVVGMTAIGSAACIWSAHWNSGHWVGAAIFGFAALACSAIAGMCVGVLLKDAN